MTESTAGKISVLLAVVIAGASIVSQFATLQESREIMVPQVADLQKRVSDLERDKEMLERIHAIEMSVGVIASDVKTMRGDVAELRGKKK
jgi:hypothetical protein